MATYPDKECIQCKICGQDSQCAMIGYKDGRCIEDWRLTREAICDENNLIGQRVNWLPLAQAFFGAVFAFYANRGFT